MEKVQLEGKKMWPLVIIDLNGGVAGAITMQKFGLVVSKVILADDPPFRDWCSNSFGGYSEKLWDALDDLETSKYIVIEQVDVKKTREKKYSITNKAEKILESFKKRNSAKVAEIGRFLDYYRGKDDEMFADTYVRFPEFTDESETRRKIQDNILARCQTSSRELVLGFDGKKINLAQIVKCSVGEPYGFYDIRFTRELAEKIGMKKTEYVKKGRKDFSDVFEGEDLFKGMKPGQILDAIENI